MSKKLLFILCFFSLVNLLKSQIILNENFDDDNFTNNPTWTPNLNFTDFIIDNKRLRSNVGTTNTTFFITTPLETSNSVIWQMSVELRFNTSSTNYVDIFLQSETNNLTDINNEGYFVRLGGTDDEVSLFRRKSGVITKIIDGTNGILNNNVNILNLKIERNQNNLWTLQTNITGTWVTQGTPIIDNQIISGEFFGILIRQSTASFFNRHFFDNIQVELLHETIPPVWESLEILDENSLKLTFSEPLQRNSIQNLGNYEVNNNIGNPQQALLLSPNVIQLNFATNFTSLQNNTLSVANIKDIAGNTMTNTSKNFRFILTFEPQFHELIITEIMFDPSGNAQPLNPISTTAEYIEIYNPTNKILRLNNCKLIDDGTYPMPDSLLFPNQYAILVKSTEASIFQSFGKVIRMNNFPSLINDGDTLVLKNAQNQLLFSVFYRPSWHELASKRDGGWSLEMLDVQNPCKEEGNWASSENARGGTPAQPNSRQINNPDLTLPNLLKVEGQNETQVLLTFDEKLKQNTPTDIVIEITPNINIQQKKWLIEDNFLQLQIILQTPLQNNQTYEMKVSNFQDCAGNLFNGNITKIFGKPMQADSSDIILNEILFNPKPNGVDFVELYNRSDKFINLQKYKIANKENNIYTNQQTITTQTLIFPPKSYLVLTTESNLLQSNHPNLLKEKVFETSLPSLVDKEGTFVLIDSVGKIIEDFYYHEDFHFDLIDDKEGVSLERIAFDLPTNNQNSWFSAAKSVNFATPTLPNSQSRGQILDDNQLVINPKTFTPNQDGIHDFTTISLNQFPTNAVANIFIYDRNGRLIKQIATNAILGTNNDFIWDGTTEQGQRCTDNVYLVVAKIFTATGGEQILRKTVAVGSRF